MARWAGLAASSPMGSPAIEAQTIGTPAITAQSALRQMPYFVEGKTELDRASNGDSMGDIKFKG